MAILDVNLMLPVVAFLCFDDPHDCFRCMGKDPDRIYSSFQMTLEDRVVRRMNTRLSKEAVKR